jgi:hypothetical protein
MPVLLSPLVGLVVGVGFAWASAAELHRTGGSAPTTRSFFLVVLFGLLIHGPLTAYFVGFNRDWAYGFVVNTARLPGVADSAVVLAAIAAPAAGFTIAARRAAEQRVGSLLQLSAIPAAVAVVALAIGLPRLAVQATFTQFHGDFGVEPVAGSRLGLSLLWMSGVLAAAVGWTTWCLRRFSKQRRHVR